MSEPCTQKSVPYSSSSDCKGPGACRWRSLSAAPPVSWCQRTANDRRLRTVEAKTQSSARYCGARPWMHLKTIMATLKSIRCQTNIYPVNRSLGDQVEVVTCSGGNLWTSWSRRRWRHFRKTADQRNGSHLREIILYTSLFARKAAATSEKSTKHTTKNIFIRQKGSSNKWKKHQTHNKNKQTKERKKLRSNRAG